MSFITHKQSIIFISGRSVDSNLTCQCYNVTPAFPLMSTLLWVRWYYIGPTVCAWTPVGGWRDRKKNIAFCKQRILNRSPLTSESKGINNDPHRATITTFEVRRDVANPITVHSVRTRTPPSACFRPWCAKTIQSTLHANLDHTLLLATWTIQMDKSLDVYTTGFLNEGCILRVYYGGTGRPSG